MSGFDLPPITGFDIGVQRNPFQGPLQSPEGSPDLQGPQLPIGDSDQGLLPGLEGGPDTAKPFAGFLADSLEGVKGLQDEAKSMVQGFVLGEDVELHDVMIAGSKSEMAFNLLLEVRNKMVDAWEKLSRSSV